VKEARTQYRTAREEFEKERDEHKGKKREDAEERYDATSKQPQEKWEEPEYREAA